MFIQPTSTGASGERTMFAQNGPLTAGGLAGNFVFNWRGAIWGISEPPKFVRGRILGAQLAVECRGDCGAIDSMELGCLASIPRVLKPGA